MHVHRGRTARMHAYAPTSAPHASGDMLLASPGLCICASQKLINTLRALGEAKLAVRSKTKATHLVALKHCDVFCRLVCVCLFYKRPRSDGQRGQGQRQARQQERHGQQRQQTQLSPEQVCGSVLGRVSSRGTVSSRADVAACAWHRWCAPLILPAARAPSPCASSPRPCAECKPLLSTR